MRAYESWADKLDKANKLMQEARSVSKNVGKGKYELAGKIGIWRTSKSGQKLFIPDDGSEILGVPSKFKDAVKSQQESSAFVKPTNSTWL